MEESSRDQLACWNMRTLWRNRFCCEQATESQWVQSRLQLLGYVSTVVTSICHCWGQQLVHIPIYVRTGFSLSIVNNMYRNASWTRVERCYCDKTKKTGGG